MPARTYIPQLLKNLSDMKRYASRWETQLQASLTTEQYECLTAVIAAVQACLNAIPPHDPNP